MFRALLRPTSGTRDYTGGYSMWYITLFKASRVVWCGAVGYESGLRDVARATPLDTDCKCSSCTQSTGTSCLHRLQCLVIVFL